MVKRRILDFQKVGYMIPKSMEEARYSGRDKPLLQVPILEYVTKHVVSDLNLCLSSVQFVSNCTGVSLLPFCCSDFPFVLWGGCCPFIN